MLSSLRTNLSILRGRIKKFEFYFKGRQIVCYLYQECNHFRLHDAIDFVAFSFGITVRLGVL